MRINQVGMLIVVVWVMILVRLTIQIMLCYTYLKFNLCFHSQRCPTELASFAKTRLTDITPKHQLTYYLIPFDRLGFKSSMNKQTKLSCNEIQKVSRARCVTCRRYFTI
ncbi:hypothetical protein BDQ12DRAFT_688571 [Crucibulum laeve]|uniref:Uncharacterized protein n=1 Tax=Crucibulum laeve TaxID=68775 RepID=A0A5C3M297_9AGAR|nr:hypothetical protein BDQ12DRAFT_688571 [Crucibulum laeve]